MSCSSRDFIVKMKTIVTQGVIAGALGFTALSVGAGVANADQPVPSSPGMTWKLDKPHWDDWRRLGRRLEPRRLEPRLAWRWSAMGRLRVLREWAMRVGAASGLDVGAAGCLLVAVNRPGPQALGATR